MPNLHLTFKTPSNTRLYWVIITKTPSLEVISYHHKHKGPSAYFPKCGTKGRWNVCFSLIVNAKGILYFLLWSQVHFSFYAFTTGILTCKMAYKTSNVRSICHVTSLSYSYRFKTKYIFGFRIHIIRIAKTLSVLLVLCLFICFPFYFGHIPSIYPTQDLKDSKKIRDIIGDKITSWLRVSKFFKVFYFSYYSFTVAHIVWPKNILKAENLVQLEDTMPLTFFLFIKLMLIINFGFEIRWRELNQRVRHR